MEFAELDADIGQAIKASAVWCETEMLHKSVPGFGDVIELTLLAQRPELGTWSGLHRHALVTYIACASPSTVGRGGEK